MLSIAVLPLAVASCGVGDTTLRDYVDELDAIMVRGLARYDRLLASPEGPVITASGDELLAYMPRDLATALAQLADIQTEALAAADDIEPSSEIPELHDLYFRRLPIDEPAARAGSASSGDDLSASPEMAAYRAALASDEVVCNELQAYFDGTAQRDAFADNPWLPCELSEIVDFALGCGSFIESPQDLYRPPAGG